MRHLLLIILLIGLGYSCIKQELKDPLPLIEFMDFQNTGKSPYTGRDTGVIYITYRDGDGDLFTDTKGEGPNFVFTPFYYNQSKDIFEVVFDPITADTFRISNTIVQPDPYYKGRPVRGEIFVPLNEFRPNESFKILKFTGFMVDMKANKSNVVTSPVYTLNF